MTVKQLRAGSPIDVLPFQVTRKHGPPALYATLNEAKRAIAKDLDSLVTYKFLTPVDLSVIANATARAMALQGPGTIEAVIDEWSGTKYSVEVVDRRL